MILYNKSEQELNAMAEGLLENTDISNTSPGARAQALLLIFNKILATYYQALDFNVVMAFVSRATGAFLDEIGVLLNCSRTPGESDDNYRYRISNHVYVVEGANKTAIRLAALSVDHVVNVELTPFVFGTGSFTVHVIVDNMENLDNAVFKVQEELDRVEAFGVKGVAVAPKKVPVFFDVVLSFFGNISDEIRAMASNDIKAALINHINKLTMGQQLVYSDLIYVAKEVGKGIIEDVEIRRMEVNRRQILIGNYKPYWDEQLYIDSQYDIVVN
jgi:hypothetical protein